MLIDKEKLFKESRKQMELYVTEIEKNLTPREMSIVIGYCLITLANYNIVEEMMKGSEGAYKDIDLILNTSCETLAESLEKYNKAAEEFHQRIMNGEFNVDK